MAPNLYMIAGPNGAGKTTFATEFLPAYAYCPHFVNADLIASDVVRRRFSCSLSNFFRYYRHLADSWMLFDNSAESPRVVAFERDGTLRIIENAVYEDMLAQQKQNEN